MAARVLEALQADNFELAMSSLKQQNEEEFDAASHGPVLIWICQGNWITGDAAAFVKELLARGVDPDYVDDQYFTALKYLTTGEAVLGYNQYHIQRLLVEHGATVELPWLCGFVVIDANDNKGFEWMHQLLVKALRDGADPNEMYCGWTSLHYLCNNRSLTSQQCEQCAELLLSHGATVNPQNLEFPFMAPSSSPLLRAIDVCCYHFVQWLLQHGADATVTRPGGITALHLLSNWHFNTRLTVGPELIKALLDHGASIEARTTPAPCTSGPGLTPLLRAIQDVCPNYAGWLIDAGADTNGRGPGGATPIMFACKARRSGEEMNGVLEALLAKGGDASAVDDSGRTGLHWLCESAVLCLQTVDTLVTAGCNLNARDGEGRTALVRLVMGRKGDRDYKFVAFVEQLLVRGASPHVATDDGEALLDLCTGPCDPLRALIERGAGAEGGGSELMFAGVDTPLTSALWRSDLEAAKAILGGFPGALVSAPGVGGDTPLHIACSKDCISMVKRLLAAGANEWARNVAGAVPADMAGKTCARLVRRSAVQSLVRAGLRYHALHEKRQSQVTASRNSEAKFAYVLGSITARDVGLAKQIMRYISP